MNKNNNNQVHNSCCSHSQEHSCHCSSDRNEEGCGCSHDHSSSKAVAVRIVSTIVSVVVLQFLPVDGWIRLACFFAVYLVIGWNIISEAVENICHGKVFDENFLMVVATIGAFALAIIDKTGDYNEAIAVMLFFQIGEFFQSYAVGKSRKSITELMDIRPDYANLERNGEIERVNPETITIGTIIVVQPGERVPIDGVVEEGISTLNTSALTGESIPKDICVGEDVVSGCVNLTGVLKVKTTKIFADSTVSKILELVEHSNSKKSESEAFIRRFARYYTPVVCYLALALAVLHPIFFSLSTSGIDVKIFERELMVWLYRALTFLVISCPCALVISIPLSFFAGIGGASKKGILIKGSSYLEALAKLKTVVFDKTGTLTLGVFEVNAIHGRNDVKVEGNSNKKENCTCCGKSGGHSSAAAHIFSQVPRYVTSNDQLLEYAAYVECSSSHPIAKSIIKAYGHSFDHSRVSEIQEISGHGVVAKVDGVFVAAGNEKLMQRLDIECCPCRSVGTIVHVAVGNCYAGHIILGDVVRPNAKEAVEALHNLGVTRTVMLTGDATPVAQQVATMLGIDEVHSELLPDDKVSELESLIADRGHRDKTNVAFVGDGINDAPVLTRADVGIAMGAMGSDAAIEAADIVLMDDDPMKIANAIRISRKCMSIVWQNIIFAIGVKLVCLVLSAFGITNMWLAVFADVGVLVLAVINAMRGLTFCSLHKVRCRRQ